MSKGKERQIQDQLWCCNPTVIMTKRGPGRLVNTLVLCPRRIIAFVLGFAQGLTSKCSLNHNPSHLRLMLLLHHHHFRFLCPLYNLLRSVNARRRPPWIRSAGLRIVLCGHALLLAVGNFTIASRCWVCGVLRKKVWSRDLSHGALLLYSRKLLDGSSVYAFDQSMIVVVFCLSSTGAPTREAATQSCMCVYLLVKCAFVVRFLVTMLGLELSAEGSYTGLQTRELPTPLSEKRIDYANHVKVCQWLSLSLQRNSTSFNNCYYITRGTSMYINNPLRKPIDLGRWAFLSRVYCILAADLLPRYDRLLVQGMRISAFFSKDHTDKFECTSIACQ